MFHFVGRLLGRCTSHEAELHDLAGSMQTYAHVARAQEVRSMSCLVAWQELARRYWQTCPWRRIGFHRFNPAEDEIDQRTLS